MGCLLLNLRTASRRIELQTVKNHAEVTALDTAKITFDPADGDAATLLKSLAVQFAFAGEMAEVQTATCHCRHAMYHHCQQKCVNIEVSTRYHVLVQGLPTRCMCSATSCSQTHPLCCASWAHTCQMRACASCCRCTVPSTAAFPKVMMIRHVRFHGQLAQTIALMLKSAS